MRRLIWSSLVALAAGGGAAAQAPAPPPGFGQAPRPQVSPYLNLLRSGNPGYLNYYGLVRPQQEFQQGLQGLQQEVGAVQSALGQPFGADLGQQQPLLPGTGHRSGFLTSGGYFMTFNGRAGGVGAGMASGSALAARPATGFAPPTAFGARPPAGGGVRR